MGGAISEPMGDGRGETKANAHHFNSEPPSRQNSSMISNRPRTHLSMIGALSNSPKNSFRETATVDQTTSDNGNEKINDYTLGAVLGRGSYATVRMCSHGDGTQYAVKIFDKKRLKRKRVGRFGSAMDSVHRELAVWKKLHHPHVLPLIEAIDSSTSTEMFLVCRYVPGGCVRPDLPKVEPLSEALTLHIFRQVIAALEYLHHQNIVHRDLKPGNLLVEGSLKDFPGHLPHIWLADFGVAVDFEGADDNLSATEGTAAFMAPEMCTGEAFSGKPTDIWAAGITTFMLIYGFTPFRAESRSIESLYDSIQTKPLEIPIEPEMPDNFKNLLHRMMDKDPNTRIGLVDINTHPWVTSNGANPSTQILTAPVSVTEAEVLAAITPLAMKVQTTVKMLLRSRQLAKTARLSILEKRSARELPYTHVLSSPQPRRCSSMSDVGDLISALARGSVDENDENMLKLKTSKSVHQLLPEVTSEIKKPLPELQPTHTETKQAQSILLKNEETLTANEARASNVRKVAADGSNKDVDSTDGSNKDVDSTDTTSDTSTNNTTSVAADT